MGDGVAGSGRDSLTSQSASILAKLRPLGLALVRSLAVCACAATPIAAEPPLTAVDTLTVDIDSGVVSASDESSDAVVVYSEIVEVDGAAWLRLRFRDVELSGSSSAGTESFLRITSLLDGGVQRLTSLSLSRSRNASAYFNGDAVLVELLAHPGTGTNRVVTDIIRMGLASGGDPADELGYCDGTDERVVSLDPRVGRFHYTVRQSECEGEKVCTFFMFDGHQNWLLLNFESQAKGWKPGRACGNRGSEW